MLRLLCLVGFFVLFSGSVTGALISSSKITDCILRGGESAAEAALSCDQKMIVALTVEGGQVLSSLSFFSLPNCGKHPFSS